MIRLSKKLMGYKIRILNDIVSKMTLAQLLLILHLIGVFEGSSSVTLGDAFREALVDEKNVAIYTAALIALGAGEDFADLLRRPFSSFDDQCILHIQVQIIRIMIPGYRRKPCTYILNRSIPDSLDLNLHSEVLVDFFGGFSKIA
jgi:hypothetical protein